MIKDLYAVFSGDVQGVGFRAESCDIARRYMIDGWVKNLSDGRVALLARGEQAEIEAFLHALEQSRLGAHIDGVEMSESEPGQDALKGFDIRY